MPTPRTVHITDPDVADFLDECGWAATTLAGARGNLARWERHCAASGVAVWDADHRTLRAHLAARQAAGIGGAQRHKEWQHARALYRWAATPTGEGGAGLLAADPMVRVVAPEIPEPSTRIATPAVAEVLVDHYLRRARRSAGADTAASVQARRDAAIVSMLMCSGMRSKEACGIDVDDLVRDGGMIVAAEVPAAYAKKRRARLVPVAPATARLLERYLRRRGTAPGPLFLARDTTAARGGRRLTPIGMQGVVRRAAAACGVEVSAHDLRRGWAVDAADRGVERGWIKLAGGWVKDATLDRYLGPQAQRLAVEAFHAAADDNTRRRGLRSVATG